MSFKQRLGKVEVALGIGEDRSAGHLAPFIAGMTDEEIDREYLVAEHKDFLKRQAAERGITSEELEAEVWEHFNDADYPSPVWMNGRLDLPPWRLREAAAE